MIKSIYFSLFNLGTHQVKDLSKAKKIKLVNGFSLAWIHASILFSIHDFILNIPIDATIGHLFTLVFMCLTLYLNHINKHLWAKLIWLTYSITSLGLFSTFIEPGTYTEYFILLFPAASLAIFSKNIVGYILIPVCFLIFTIPYYIIPAYPQTVIDGLQISVPLLLTICIFLTVIYFKTQNGKNEKLLFLEKDKVLSDKIILEHQQEELKKLNEFKSHFFINISHEIRTPLTLIKGYRDLLDFNKSEKENTPSIKVIDEQLGEINNLIDTILDIGKLDENKILLDKKKQSVNMLLHKVYADFKTMFEQQNINLLIELLREDVEVNYDFNLINRSFGNILNNALKFTPENGEVKIIAKNENENLLLQITDTGIGIAIQPENKIFDRFYQVKNDVTKSKGSGIGLSYTKSIMDKHEFEINAYNNIDKGACISISIPKNHIHTNLITINTETINKEKKTILVVDDHPQMRLYLKTLLVNYNVIEAKHGKEAFDIIKTTTIDLLVTDYMMPIMDGWELVNKVKKENYTFPVFIITARTDTEGKVNMLRMGVDHYFTKPFYKEEFLYSIQNALGYYQVITKEAISENVKGEKTNRETVLFEKPLRKIIMDNLSNYDFGIEDIANELNVSSKTLTRKTKLYLGQTPNQLMVEIRLLKAKEFIENHPDFNLSKIASMVGFKNTTYLKKRFKERFKMIV